MKTTRFGATIALGLAAGLALSACGSSGAQTGDSTSGAGPTQVSMLLDWAPNPDMPRCTPPSTPAPTTTPA